jgi:hypothetical protein
MVCEFTSQGELHIETPMHAVMRAGAVLFDRAIPHSMNTLSLILAWNCKRRFNAPCQG